MTFVINSIIHLLLACLVLCAVGHAAEQAAIGPRTPCATNMPLDDPHQLLDPSPEDNRIARACPALAEYVAKPDASYCWVKRREGRLGTGTYAELTLTSQTWRGIVWKHRLFVIRPSTVRPDSKHGLLYIGGGEWDDGDESVPQVTTTSLDDRRQPSEKPTEQNRRNSACAALPSAEDEPPPGEVRWLADMAERLGTPVVVLRNVPRQPMFGGRYEDQLISLTFDEYLATGDPEWPLLLPMVKSAVRAMDAAGQYAEQRWQLPIETYTVTGKSKRGWTTWLLGAVDARATAIAPMVIDVLNMARQMEHQRRTWGDFSYKIGDYTERGLQGRMATPGGRTLLSIVDPYHYRHRLKQPKLIVIGTNDHYWPLDALNLYWDDLAGDKYLLYVPNNRHDLADLPRVAGAIGVLHRHAATGRPMPELSWRFTLGDDHLSLHVHADPPAHETRAWIATSPTRDFREAHWTAFPMARDTNRRHRYELAIPSTGFAALFGEFAYRTEPLPYSLSTNVRIVSRATSEDGPHEE
uniref:PhoPQ-activated pathogenicity-related protein n=1 Tax=Candidatus Kentrum sp. FM TaxID=2126340 RepID=A0A450TUV7_9GAMM|nr:MAG: PhoPQ-activated pathogenicity-related protein [Candidatus Kentron sp. FM]VFJ72771.1 MAG: PhoPQ-activated pathogenicity-related protein [Candidatus Kentron sp. FM]VFK19320.1 MAG: PhoPQ-activated pathogenicity-related protein [Candidatus Kentron sp. FM]